jgi:SAM-dependent methyltransferase
LVALGVDTTESRELLQQQSEPETVADLMTRREDCLSPESTLSELISCLADLGRAVPVIQEHEWLDTVGAPAVVKLLAAGRDPDRTRLTDVIRTPRASGRLAMIPPDASLDEARSRMVLEGTTQALVIYDGQLLGVISWPTIDAHLYRAPDGFPLPPRELTSLVVWRPSQWGRKSFFESGAQSAEIIRTVLEQYDRPIERSGALLEFGCGCGRVIRHFQHSAARLHGSDYNEKLIAWCRANLPFATFAVNRLEPGLEYEDDTFDLIYTISVFTHLPASLQTSWVAELRRILKPGGTLLVTVHGESRTDFLSAEDRKRFAAGDLVVVKPERAGANDCSAFHPRPYLEGEFILDMRLLAHVPDAMFTNQQDVVLLAKPA